MKFVEVKYGEADTTELIAVDGNTKRVDYLGITFTFTEQDDGNVHAYYTYILMDYMNSPEGEKREIEGECVLAPNNKLRRTYMLRRRTLEDVINPSVYYLTLLQKDD